MPMGLWKSKWEIHREDMGLYREEMREDRARWEAEERDLRERSDGLRADYSHEIEETRLFDRELQIRMEKTYANLGTTLQYVGEELGELKAAVRAHTAAVLKLVDRFEEWDGRPPA
jgi:hypothetical protein